MTRTAPPLTRDELFAALDGWGVAHATTDHPPVFRVEEGEAVKAAMPGGHTKNLFLKDARGRLWLITALGETAIDLKAAAPAMGAARLSFASPERLWAALGVRPGSVTPLALLNDLEREVTLVLDEALMEHGLLNFHPLSNNATTAIPREDFLHLLKTLGREPKVLDFATLGAAVASAPGAR